MEVTNATEFEKEWKLDLDMECRSGDLDCFEKQWSETIAYTLEGINNLKKLYEDNGFEFDLQRLKDRL